MGAPVSSSISVSYAKWTDTLQALHVTAELETWCNFRLLRFGGKEQIRGAPPEWLNYVGSDTYVKWSAQEQGVAEGTAGDTMSGSTRLYRANMSACLTDLTCWEGAENAYWRV